MLKKLNSTITITILLSINLIACNKETVETENTSKATAVKTKSIKAAEVVNITNPRIRALPPGQKVTAMYMQLENSSDIQRDLVKVESPVSNMIEIHTHTNNNGVMQMGLAKSLPVPANGSIQAKPGGYHVMIMGLQEDLKLGDKVDFNLIFKDGSNKSITAEVKTLETH